jgi:effector-binding domain-containing protein
MKKILSILILFFFLLGLIFCCSEKAEKEENKSNTKLITPIKIETIQKVTAAKYEYVGNLGQIGNQIAKLATWVNKKQLKVVGAPFILYFDDPTRNKPEPEECRNEIYIPVVSKKLKDGEFEVVDVPEVKVVTAIAQGPYIYLYPVYSQLHDWITKNNVPMSKDKMYVREDYINDPMKVKPEEIQTKISIPVK